MRRVPLPLFRLARSLRAKTDLLLRMHGDKIDKGIASAKRFAKSKTRNNPSRSRSVEQAAGKIRGALAGQRQR